MYEQLTCQYEHSSAVIGCVVQTTYPLLTWKKKVGRLHHILCPCFSFSLNLSFSSLLGIVECESDIKISLVWWVTIDVYRYWKLVRLDAFNFLLDFNFLSSPQINPLAFFEMKGHISIDMDGSLPTFNFLLVTLKYGPKLCTLAFQIFGYTFSSYSILLYVYLVIIVFQL